MMPTKYDTELISKSWDDFVDRLRYSVLFKARVPNLVPIKGQLPNFDPDYAVKRPQQRACQQLDRAFEFGILEGARAISQMVSNMPREFKTGGLYNSPFVIPPIRQIHDYLTQHQLVVLVTDKNLGCAVAPRTWIIDKTTRLLSSEKDYECISYDTAETRLRQYENSLISQRKVFAMAPLHNFRTSFRVRYWIRLMKIYGNSLSSM